MNSRDGFGDGRLVLYTDIANSKLCEMVLDYQLMCDQKVHLSWDWYRNYSVIYTAFPRSNAALE